VDVYAVGDGMYHFDGSRWTPVVPLAEFVEYHDIIGFSASDIWVVGERIYPNPNPPPNFLDSALIIHYDGSQWRESQRMPARGLWSMWGNSPTNIYAGSLDGKILRYDGSIWTLQQIRENMQIISLGGDGNILFAGGSVTISFPDTQMIYANSGTGWYLVDQQLEGESFWDPRFGYSAIFSPGPGIIYSSTWGIFKWENNYWSRIIQWGYALRDIAGDRPDNVFVIGWEPTVFHWNGQDWQRIAAAEQKMPPVTVLSGVWTDGNEVFIVGDDGWRGYVLHGK